MGTPAWRTATSKFDLHTRHQNMETDTSMRDNHQQLVPIMILKRQKTVCVERSVKDQGKEENCTSFNVTRYAKISRQGKHERSFL